ncbi:MAG: alpha/beta fold hydrolase, partial [Planctomycetia bacterium]
MIKVLFLRGSSAAIGGRKYEALRQERDFEVLAPELPFPAWRPKSVAEHFKWGGEAVVKAVLEPARTAAEEAADQFKPDVIVGSSMGGVLAIGVASEAARVLIAPAVEFAVPGITFPN